MKRSRRITTSQPWWQTTVIYQIYPRSFQDTTGNGVGDLLGITSRIGYLADTLGVGAIWVSPFYPSPMTDFGYDITDYTDVDTLFGDLDDFDELIEAAHRNSIKVIIDWVPNHTSCLHPWFIESRSSRQNPKRDWYTWRDPKPDGSPPNNWLATFGGIAWKFDEDTGQYYLHSFLSEQPDLNWRNPQVQEAMFDTVRFWLDRGVDGLRIDAAHFIMKDPELRDNPPVPNDWQRRFKDSGDYDKQLHIHDKHHADTHRVFSDLRRLLNSYQPDRYAIGEIHIADWDEWASFYGRDLDELHMPYNLSLIHTPWDAESISTSVSELEAAIPEGAWPNYTLGNHDEIRLSSRIGPDATRVAAMLLLTLRGTPTLYYGDELGMTQVDIAPEDQQDPFGRNLPGAGRDGARTPMQWDGGINAGFSSTNTPKTWLPTADDQAEHNVKQQSHVPTSILNLYRELLRYRGSSVVLQSGDYKQLDSPHGCYAYVRIREDSRTLIALNFTNNELRLPVAECGRIALSTHLDREDEAVDSVVTLRPNEGIIVELA